VGQLRKHQVYHLAAPLNHPVGIQNQMMMKKEELLRHLLQVKYLIYEFI
jgi:hypothetical protein